MLPSITSIFLTFIIHISDCPLNMVLSHAPTLPLQPQQHPNMVFILVDDMGYMDASIYGHPFYETPHVDALAISGTRFTRAYAASPFCSPSRAAILTGMVLQITMSTHCISSFVFLC